MLFCILIIFLAGNIEAEIKRIQATQGRKLFNDGNAMTSSPSSSASSNREQPLFTMKQVTMICQRMLKEREGQIREEYDKILSAKLLGRYMYMSEKRLF